MAVTKLIEPHEDYGFFGPESVTWKVWRYPTSLTVGFQRAVVIEELDPALVASVDQTRAIFDRARTRYDRTLRYFATIAFGDSRSASTSADVLVKIHSKAIGNEPLSGKRYDANDPDSQLWIHLTAWHSILFAYEKYGPGKLTPAEEARYWEECAVAAELQTCSPDDVPRTRDGVRAYFAHMRPKLAGSEVAQQTMAHLLDARIMLPPVRKELRPISWLATRALRAGTIATMPQWMRRMGGLRQPRAVDALITPVLRVGFRLVHANTRMEMAHLRYLSPMTAPVVEPIAYDIAATHPHTTTPADARARFGFDRPVDAHHDLRARQAKRVFGDGHAPSDEGIVESEPVLGSIA